LLIGVIFIWVSEEMLFTFATLKILESYAAKNKTGQHVFSRKND